QHPRQPLRLAVRQLVQGLDQMLPSRLSQRQTHLGLRFHRLAIDVQGLSQAETALARQPEALRSEVLLDLLT
ncbi:hypothetical protein, partial [Salmonella enterica]|uniref:hypothetical protein n=1 Tax=Salmonella enterica TaxID=28901 RepID=UPI0039E7318A